jgi:4-hydroxybenzoate polyprenyltransferase
MMGSLPAQLVRLARPWHWIKNGFVLVPVPFALAVGAKLDFAVFALGLLGFCLINSAVYTLNDLCDAKADREHPKKRHRPIAAGEVSTMLAIGQILLLVGAGMGLGAATGKAGVVPLCAVYVGVNLAYSLGAKHAALLDVFLLSSGFVIRVLLGCALVAAVASPWLLLCTSALALFLGFAKRRGDVLAGMDENHRPSLRGYSRQFLDTAITICAGVALLTYALYSMESKVLIPGRAMASMPFVAYGILNYLRLTSTGDAGGSPVEVAYTSRSTQLCGLGWILAVVWSLKL